MKSIASKVKSLVLNGIGGSNPAEQTPVKLKREAHFPLDSLPEELKSLITEGLPGSTKRTVAGLNKSFSNVIASQIEHLEISAERFPDFIKTLQLTPGLKRYASLKNVSITMANDSVMETLAKLDTDSREKITRITSANFLPTITDNGLRFINAFPKLQSLDLTGCPNLTKAGLTNLQELQDLRTLNLTLCFDLKDDDIEPLRQLPQLQSLNLNSCTKLSDKSIARLSKKLPNLESLDLSGCSITPPGLAPLKELKALESLKLTRYDLRLIIATLKELTTLRYLRLKESFTPDEALAELLAGLPNLQSLDVSHSTALDGDRLGNLVNLPKMTSLNLSSCCYLTNKGVENFIQKCPSLQTLNLSSNHQLSGDALIQIGQLENFRSLDLSGCYNITDKDIEHLQGLETLESLNMDGCTKLTETGLVNLFKKLPELKTLNLSGGFGCIQVTDAVLESLEASTKLQALNLHRSNQFTDTGLANLLAKLPNLQTLKLSSDQITDAGLKPLTNSKGLQSLDLSGCHQISDDVLKSLGRSMELRSLHLAGCSNITDAGLYHLTALTGLRKLLLNGCSNVTDDFLKSQFPFAERW